MHPSGMSQTTKSAVLFCFLLVCGAGFVLTQKVREHLPAPAPHELFAIVNQQLAAFRSADIQSAYRQAATGVQQRFTLPQFEKMVRQKYPAVGHVRRVEYGLVRVQGGSAVVQVFFIDGEGAVRCFLYSLTHEDGGWKIDGVDELDGVRAGDRLAGTIA